MSTVIVTGLPGTGKTLLTQVLIDLGIPMVLAEGEPDGTYEDADMKYAFTYTPFAVPLNLIFARNDLHPVWGFKFACLSNSASPILFNYFRDPRLIILHRDVVSVAAHNGLTGEQVLEEEQRLFYLARHLRCPILHLSSEKFFRNPMLAVAEIEDFLHDLPLRGRSQNPQSADADVAEVAPADAPM